MKTIKVLGTGCAKCKQVEAIVKEVVAAEGIEATVEKVEDIQKIMAYNVMMTPAVVVDEVVKIKGKVPSREEVKALLSE